MNAPFAEQTVAMREADLSDPSERRRIDDWVMARTESTPFHRPQWVRAVEAGTGQRARYLLAESRGAIAGVMPLTLIRSALFGRALVSAGFAVGGGALALSPRLARMLGERAWELAAAEGCASAELRGGERPSEEWRESDATYAGFARRLADDREAELLAVPRKQRAEIRKALRNGLEVRTGRDSRDRDDHYAVYAESVRNLGTPVFPRKLFDSMLDTFGKDADILTVSKDGRPLASVLSFYHRGIVMPYWGGGLWEARALRANELMYFELMNHARERGCQSFDFGRSKIGTGPYSFKKNWGFDPQVLTYYERTGKGASPRDINPASAKYRLQVALWKRLPLWIANRAGPWIAKGLG